MEIEIVPLLTALGVGAVLKELVVGVVRWLTGRAATDRDRAKSLVEQRNEAWLERDREAKRRRVMEEYAHSLRADAHTRGIPYEDQRPWPRTSRPPQETP